LNFGISFDFWNTLYGNGDEQQRYKNRVEYFYKVISKYIKTDHRSIEKVFSASSEFFVYEWQNNLRTPTAGERIKYMSKLLSVNLSSSDITDIVNCFGKLIFSIPPQMNHQNLSIVRQLAKFYPLGIISDTGYISGKYIRQFLLEQEMISCFRSLIFSDEHSHCKPHSSVFNLTCKNLKISSSKLIHVGDLEKTDVRGAIDSGGICIKYTGWYNQVQEESQAHYVIDTYQKLSQTITKITDT
jgi:putative hydrolase of the HAD superfamily